MRRAGFPTGLQVWLQGQATQLPTEAPTNAVDLALVKQQSGAAHLLLAGEGCTCVVQRVLPRPAALRTKLSSQERTVSAWVFVFRF